MVVQHNLTAMNANRYLGINNSKLSKSLEKLSSGYAINRAGDNAAGLAVSEKMRAQIAGMTQGVKNAQDGISMVQTFEGALTETDSILQRMKTLANQSANGTYQDDVDRDAIQLEFDQLNDELNQIADTDFNGVVALNGGQMADGLKATDAAGAIVDGNTPGSSISGHFDYTNKEQQVIDAAKAEAQKKVDALSKELETLTAAKESGKFDITEGGAADGWKGIDKTPYNKTTADDLWVKAGLKTDDNKADLSKGTKLNVTYTKQDDGTWKATAASTNKGVAVESLDALTASNQNLGANATGAGGFKDVEGNNIIFDANSATVGSTVTIVYENAEKTKLAPDNIGFDGGLTYDKSEKGEMTTPTFTVNATDDTMTAEAKAVLDALQGKELKFTFTAGTAAPKVELDSVELTAGTKSIGGKNIFVTINGTNLKVSTKSATGNAADVDLFTIAVPQGNTDAAGQATAVGGTMSGTIKIAEYSYADPTSSVSVTAGDDPLLKSSGGLTQQIADKQAELEEAKTARDSIKTYEDAVGATSGVSVSDSFNQSNAKLTYTNNITLQVGARTKDAVNFTFNYKSNGLGDLKANMNCSAREDGLNTSGLNLKTAKDANFAIDRIDNAINKVSMVRATFGAVQNRLEHKIDNMNVSIENLTSAESQIRDTNMPTEMMNFTKQQILAQASQSMLAQANQLPQGVLSLLQ